LTKRKILLYCWYEIKKEEKMGMIIRVAFNNRNWMGKCTNVKDDDRFFKCSKKVVATGYRVDKNGNCVSEDCWEQHLCKKYRWRTDHGNFKRAQAKEPVFFVFPDVDNSLVLWGMSKIKEVKGNEIYFDEFKPLPQEKWVRGLSSKDLIGKPWGNGTYRYIGPDKEAKLKKLIGGH
jgi:hypothetical protein